MQNFSTRRNFLKFGFLSSSVFVMSGCELFSITTPYDTIKLLQHDLFPQAKKLNIDTASYMTIVFHHTRITKEDKEFLKSGVKWLNEEAVKMYKTTYIKLLSTQREEVLTLIAQQEWGENFLHDIFGYLFEAMLGDPIYGSNNNEAGWKWLEFSGGKPRPKEMYL